MMQLLEVLGEHLPAIERDLIVSGFHLYDIGTPKLSWAELESFVMAAPPDSATHTSRTESWNRDAQIAAAILSRNKPPAGNTQGGGGARGEPPMNARDGRARNLRVEPQPNPNAEVKQLLGKVRLLPLDQFKDQREQVRANNAKVADEESA